LLNNIEKTVNNTSLSTTFNNETFLNRPHPFKGESIRSYISRLSTANYYKTPKWIENGLKTYTKGAKKFHPDTANNQQLQLLAALSLTPWEDLYSMTLHQYADKLWNTEDLYNDNNGHLFVNSKSLRKNLSIFGSKYCPLCLQERRYHRVYWDLRHVTTCLEHCTILVDRCSYCGKKVTVKEILAGTHTCGRNLMAEPAIAADHSTLHAQTYIQKLLCISAPSYDYRLPESSLFDFPEPSCFFRLIESFTAVLAVMDVNSTFFKTCKHKINEWVPFSGPTDKLTNWERNVLIAVVFDILLDWPNHFYTFLDEFRRRGNDSYFPGLSLEYRPLGHMFKKLQGQVYSFLQESFKDYLLKRFSGAPLRRKNRHYTKKEYYDKRIYLGPEEASNDLGVSFSLLTTLIQLKMLASIPCRFGSRTTVIVERQSIENLKREWADFLSVDQVSERLGVTSATVIEIINHNFLQAERITTRHLLIKKNDFDSFERKFLSGESIDQCNDKEAWFTMQEVATHFDFVVMQTSRILHFIDNGILKPLLNLSRKGLNMLAFKKLDIHKCKALLGLENNLLSKYETINIDNIRTYLVPLKKGAKEVCMAHERAAKLLGATPKTIEKLIQCGFLKATKKQNCSGKTISRITLRSFLAFREEYIPIRQAAELLGVRSEKILQLIRSRRLKKVIPLGSDKRYRYLVSAAELTDLKNNLLSIEEAAKRLRVNVSFFENLIYSGIVRALKLSRSRTFVHLSELERAERTRDKKLTLAELESYLMISRGDIIKLIDDKDILSASDQEGDERITNTFTQLDADFLGTVVNQSEAARILTVTSGAVIKWTDAGLLRPTVVPNIDGSQHYGFRRIDVLLFKNKRASILSEGRKKLTMSRFPAMSVIVSESDISDDK